MKQKVDELDELMDNKFYHPEIKVFYPNMESDSSGMIQFDDDTLMKQMKQDIKMKDVQELREHFDKFCEKYRHKNESSQINIKISPIMICTLLRQLVWVEAICLLSQPS